MKEHGAALLVLVLAFGTCNAAYDPGDPKADHRARAIELDEAGDIRGAIDAFRAATVHDPSSSENW